MYPAVEKSKWFGIACAIMLLAVIGAFAYTGEFYLLVIPFAFLFFAYAGLNWKGIFWILLFTIPASTQLSFAGETMSITLPDEPIMWTLFGIFFLMLARKPNIIPKWWWRDPLVLIIVLQFLWLIVAVCFSKVPFFSVKFLIAKMWLMTCFIILPIWVFKEKKDFVKGFVIMLIPMLITMLVILIHHAILGFKFARIQDAVRYIYYNHVDYSTVISMYLPFVYIAYRLLKGKSKALRRLFLFLIVFFLIAIYLSYARAALIAVVFSIAIGLGIRYKVVNYIMPTFYALVILLVSYMATDNNYFAFRPDYNSTYMHKDFTNHLLATLRGKDMSSMERLYRWIAAIRMSKDRPITGYGPHAFYYYYKPYAVPMFKTYVSRNPEQSTTHNYFLYMLVEQGWPAMILYGVLIFMIFYQAQKIYYRFNDRFYKLCTLGIAMCIAAGFINNFFSELIETHKVGALFYIPLSLLIILNQKSKEQSEPLIESD